MSTKRARNASATVDDAVPLFTAAIKTGDIAKVQHIMNELRILTTLGQSRLDSLTSQIGTGVVLVNSTCIDPSDISSEIPVEIPVIVIEVRGLFTAGPNRHPFDIQLVTEHYYCAGGDTNTMLTGPCFEVRNGGPDRCYCPGKPEHNLPINFFDDYDIEEFLMNAGLNDAQPERVPTDDDMTPKTRRRWVIGDVIHDAIELLKMKYDGEVDKRRGKVDMHQKDAYHWMGLMPGKCPSYWD